MQQYSKERSHIALTISSKIIPIIGYPSSMRQSNCLLDDSPIVNVPAIAEKALDVIAPAGESDEAK
jgi:hypothetical protein